MPLFNGNDLLAAGWPPGPWIAAMLKEAADMEARGIHDPAYALKLLRRAYPPPDPKRPLRSEPAPLTEAIAPTNPDDEANIAACRRFMNDLLRVPVVERGSLMPDACPAGAARATIPVGGAIAVRSAIIPAAHSADICCSLHATFFRADLPVARQLDALASVTRFGFGGRPEEQWVHHPVLDEPVWDNPFLRGLERHAAMHLADQGDGNHFAFLGKVTFTRDVLRRYEAAGHDDFARRIADQSGDSGEFLALVTHHGSRGLGAHVYKRGQQAALDHTGRVAQGIPDAAAWLDTTEPDGIAYWDALQYISRWTLANHHAIHDRFLRATGATAVATMSNEHNFVWQEGDLFLHGKGATPAWTDAFGRPLPGLIPLNMAAPILMVLGRQNREFLSFAPHGAGRNFSRTAIAKPYRDRKTGLPDPDLVRKAIAAATPGLDIRWFCGTPDVTESPLGYKPADQVRAQIETFGLADITAEITPLGSLMAGDPGPAPWKRRKDELSPKQLRQIEHRADRRKLKQHLLHPDEEADDPA
jgi:RNA-splicing ligase RtcB